jgi:hypothetical protein
VTVVGLSAQEMEGFARSRADNPVIAKLQDLNVEEAERAGGIGLAAMRLYQGQIFGEPVMMSIDEVAKRLGVSEEAVLEAIAPIQEAAAERWKASEQFKRWRSPENFTYANFSRQARHVVWGAGVLAFEAGADAVTTNHLRAALQAPVPTREPRPGETVTNFDKTLVAVVRSAHASAVGAGEEVELRHLHQALHTVGPAE